MCNPHCGNKCNVDDGCGKTGECKGEKQTCNPNSNPCVQIPEYD
jgi:hypothetical protein